MKAWLCMLSRGDAAEPETLAAYDGYGRTSQITAAGQPTRTFAYAATGEQVALTQAVAVTNALGNVTVYEYDLRGNKTYEGGATYSVRYAYDVFGNKTSMTTYRNEASGVGDTTTWAYDEATGLLPSKAYADGKGLTYTYTDPRSL